MDTKSIKEHRRKIRLIEKQKGETAFEDMLIRKYTPIYMEYGIEQLIQTKKEEKHILAKYLKTPVKRRKAARKKIEILTFFVDKFYKEHGVPRTIPHSWSKQIKARDGKCMVCGSKHELEAHHIYPKIQYPEKALDIEYGITLCSKCHRLDESSVHRILGHIYTQEQWATWYHTKKTTIIEQQTLI